MKKLTLIITVLLLAGTAMRGNAQVDPHFSQYYADPLWLNPALTGAFDGDIRLSSNFRDQWTGLSDGYKTGGLTMDFRPTQKVGIGLNILNQAAGTAGYNYFTAGISFSYNIAVADGGLKKLHFGVEAGLINRSFDPSKLQLDDQYNPGVGFDPNMPSFETFSASNAVSFDSSVGVFYYDADPTSKAKIFGGISVAHLTDEKDPFAADGLQTKLPMRFTIHGGVKIAATDNIDVTPNLIYIRQQQNQIKAAGAYSEFKLQDDSGLILGAMYRINDAAVADIGYHLNNMVVGISYDFTTSALNTATSGQGGFELSLNYVFGKKSSSSASTVPMF